MTARQELAQADCKRYEQGGFFALQYGALYDKEKIFLDFSLID